VLDLWLGPEGAHYLREQMLKQYIARSMGASGSDIDRFEGRGAINFLDLDSRRVGEEGEIVDPGSVASLPLVDGRLELPQFDSAPRDGFIQSVQASPMKWAILTEPDGAPQLLLNADRFLRALFADEGVDPHDYCVKPIITHDPQATLEQTLMSANLVENESTEKGIILLWGSKKRSESPYTTQGNIGSDRSPIALRALQYGECFIADPCRALWGRCSGKYLRSVVKSINAVKRFAFFRRVKPCFIDHQCVRKISLFLLIASLDRFCLSIVVQGPPYGLPVLKTNVRFFK